MNDGLAPLQESPFNCLFDKSWDADLCQSMELARNVRRVMTIITAYTALRSGVFGFDALWCGFG
jgi:hypothetical protein